jgi:hypothetical protein
MTEGRRVCRFSGSFRLPYKEGGGGLNFVKKEHTTRRVFLCLFFLTTGCQPRDAPICFWKLRRCYLLWDESLVGIRMVISHRAYEAGRDTYRSLPAHPPFPASPYKPFPKKFHRPSELLFQVAEGLRWFRV